MGSRWEWMWQTSSGEYPIWCKFVRVILGGLTQSWATRAEIQRKDVELDQALQDRETATSELESTLETVQKELAQVKEERDTLGASCH